MNAGELRHRITVQQATETPDNRGQPISTWSTYYECWAKIETTAVRENYIARQKWPESDLVITIRGNSKANAITPKMRVLFSDPKTGATRTFNLMGKQDLSQERGIRVQLVCREEG